MSEGGVEGCAGLPPQTGREAAVRFDARIGTVAGLGSGCGVVSTAPVGMAGGCSGAGRRARRRAAEAKRIQGLQAFAPREAEAWREVVALIEETKPASYDKAVPLLLKLRDLADYQSRMPDFQTRLAGLQERYANRPALRDRLQRARLI